MVTPERHIFLSYCRAEASWLDRLRVHLRPVIRQAAVDLWDDSRIVPGQDWHDEIRSALKRAHVAILLISADYLASDFLINNELPPILHRAAHDGLLVLPLIVTPCLFREHEELSRYQCVNSPDNPLSGMSQSDIDATLLAVARNVAHYFKRLDSAQRPPPVEPAAIAHSARSPWVPRRTDHSRPLAEPLRTHSPHGPLVVERPLNLGFDGPTEDGIPAGWFNSFGHVTGVSTDYTIEVLRRSQDRRHGMCVSLMKPPPAPGQFGSLMQRCPGQFLAGKTVRLMGELRTENVSGWAGLWLRADAEEHPNLFFDNMARRPVLGTTDWASYSIDAPIPSSTAWLNYGIVLSGAGTLYADNLRLLAWNREGRWEDV